MRSVCVYVCVCVCMGVCMGVCMCVCVCVCWGCRGRETLFLSIGYGPFDM